MDNTYLCISPRFGARNSVPSAILVILRIPSLAQSWASRAVMAILDLIDVVILRHCRMGAQHKGRWTIILAAPQRCGASGKTSRDKFHNLAIISVIS